LLLGYFLARNAAAEASVAGKKRLNITTEACLANIIAREKRREKL
jgi:hypothetical protein